MLFYVVSFTDDRGVLAALRAARIPCLYANEEIMITVASRNDALRAARVAQAVDAKAQVRDAYGHPVQEESE